MRQKRSLAGSRNADFQPGELVFAAPHDNSPRPSFTPHESAWNSCDEIIDPLVENLGGVIFKLF